MNKNNKLTKITMAAGVVICGLLLQACASTSGASKNGGFRTIEAGKAIITNIDSDGSAVQYGKTVDGFQNVTVVKCGESESKNLATVDLSDYEDMELDFDFSCDLKIEDANGSENDINWMVNDFDAGFPEISRKKISSGEWVHFEGKKSVALSGKRQFYVSGSGIKKADVTVYIKDFNLVLSCDEIGKEKKDKVSWTDAPSLAKAYEKYFDYIGFATPLTNMLERGDVVEGLEHQASSITMENEFKPDFMFAWQKPGNNLTDFVAEDGKTYRVPKTLAGFTSMDRAMRIAKYAGVHMRGHVLVWHSQTPDWFFRENYGSTKDPLVDEATMTARQEWYIKTVLQHVKEWEVKNNNDERLVTVWDVVNEAASDGATKSQWLRTDSNWYRVYKSDKFIVNAFRYANKYAPKEVKLAYNDYGNASPVKADAICRIVDAIQANPETRIDVVGMQTHIGMNTQASSLEAAIKKYVAKGLDVQITEMDIGQDGQSYRSEALKNKYKSMFKMFLANRKTDSQNGVCGVTLWGIVDERSWIYSKGSTKQHPLLFEGDFICKPAFYGVLEAAQEAE